MMNRQIQPRRPVRQPRRAGAGERAAREIEAALQHIEARERVGFVVRDDLDERRRLVRLRRVGRMPRAVRAACETLAKRRVVREHRIERARECVGIERPAHVERDRLVPVAAIRHVEREEAVLRGRERPDLCADGRRRLGGRLRRRGVVDLRNAREFGDRRAVEQLFRREAHAALACARNHLQHENRVAAELEEVVMAADARCFQHGLPYLGEYRFGESCGASPAALPTGRAASSRSAARSILPFAVTGRRASAMHCAGTM